MRLDRLSAVVLLTLAITACGRQAPDTSEEQSAPAVAPITAAPQEATKHYTQADYDRACFSYPTPQEIAQFQQVAGISAQGAVDYQYQQWAKRYPGSAGYCEQKKQNEQSQQSQRVAPRQGTWIENAPANDMSHYGDALPEGKN